MRTPLSLIVFALALTLACSRNPASPGGLAIGGSTAITNGTPTGAGSFQNVGALLFDFDENHVIDGNDELCTGSLIAPTVFLTAGHCLSFLPAGSTLYVSFAPDLYAAGITVITATGFAIDSAYGHDNADPVDLGIVTLPSGSTGGITPLSLPPAGLLDTLSAQNGLKNQNFINVGYGTGAARTGTPSFPYDGVRKMSIAPFKSLEPNWLTLLMNISATGQGGDCYGDSGGPKFIAGDTSRIVAIVSQGDIPCRALSKNYRLDTPSARAVLGRFVPLP